jgi:hypothetical protein
MRKLLFAIPVLFLGAQFPAAAEVNVVPPGSEISVRMNEGMNLRKWDNGRVYRGELERDVIARDGDLVFRRRTPVEVVVRQVGDHEMAVDLESILADGRRYVVDATAQDFNTKDRPGVGGNARTGKFVGGGAVIGSIIGAIAGGGKGAAIGAAAGAAGGAGAQMATRGREIHIPAESVLTFRLERALRVAEGPDPGVTRDGRHYHNYR